MTEREMHRLSRKELLEMLLEQEKRGRGTEGVVGQEVAGKQKDIDR